MALELNPKPAFCYVCGKSLELTKKTDYRDYYECPTGHKFGFTKRDNMGDCDYLLYLWQDCAI